MKRLFALVLSFCMALSIGVCAAAAETPLRENENGVLLSSCPLPAKIDRKKVKKTE